MRSGPVRLQAPMDKDPLVLVVPVVLLVLPVTVFFAFWPGVVGLSLTTP